MTVPVAGPFYLALVNATETTFGPEHLRMDLYVFSARRTLAEGQKPALELEIENPRVGLISAGRKFWVWFAVDVNTETVPLFFGRLVATPVDLSQEIITIQVVADPLDYRQRVQRAAQPLKVLPYWDPVFIDVGKRDDPDTILEARAAFWNVDATSHAVTAVGIVDGPDGNIDVTNHIHDSLKISIGDPPATAILMDASVSWTQSARGIIDVGTSKVRTLTPDGIIGGWPKALQSLGGGWNVHASDAYDSLDANSVTTHTWSWSYQSKEKTHSDGDIISASWSTTRAVGGSIGPGIVTNMTYQPGFVDAFASDGDGDPTATNIPMSYNQSQVHVVNSQVITSLVLEYAAERPRTERVRFMVRADTQPVLSDPEVSKDSETITLSGADVGVPIVDLLNWSSIAGQSVGLNTIIFPDDPDLPGSQVAQIAVVSGTAGVVEPEFSDVPGDEVIDGTVTWASLGQTAPPDNSKDWEGEAFIPAGTIILPKQPLWADFSVLTVTSSRTMRPDSMSEGEYTRFDDGGYGVCTLSGEIGQQVTEAATIVDLASLPSGGVYWLAVQSGVTGQKYVIPDFGSNETIGSRVTDNGVVWQCIGIGDIPAGGFPGQIHAASYFPTARGLLSLEYLGLRVRARLLYRARCVELAFDTDYFSGIEFTTRKTVTLHDPRLPGGVAVGKVKGAVLSVSDGVATCSVTIACTIGKDNTVSASTGTPDYVADGYVTTGYQHFTGLLTLLPNGSDLAYAPPVYVGNDDGLTFPLTLGQVLVKEEVHGSPATQALVASGQLQAMKSLVQSERELSTLSMGLDFITAHEQTTQSPSMSIPSVWVEVVLKPVNSGPFHKIYNVKFSNLTMSRDIDLESETTT